MATVSQSITTYYNTYLGRPPTASELTYWVNGVNNGYSLTSAQNDIKSAPEAKLYSAKQSITPFYQTYLGHAPDATGLDYWANKVVSGQATVDQVEQAIKATPEATTYAIATAWTTAYDKAPTAEELKYWNDKVTKKTMTADQVVKGLKDTAQLQSTYTTYLGRPATADDLRYWQEQIGLGKATTTAVVDSIKTSPDAKVYAATPDIKNAYQTYLGRPPTATELSDWAKKIGDGSATVSQITSAIQSAPEAKAYGATATITDAYTKYIGHAPDAAGLQFWKDKIISGAATPATITSAIQNSSEAKTYAATTAVTSAFNTYLGRPPEASALDFWVNKITSGQATAAEVSTAIKSSQEGSNTAITNAYKSYIGTAPDAAGLKFWQDKVLSGQATVDQVVAGIKASPQAQAYSATTAIKNAYQTYMGRDPDAAGLKFWQDKIASGAATPETVVAAIRNSDEAKPYTAIADSFQTIFGRDPKADEVKYWQGKVTTDKLTPEKLFAAMKATDAASTYRTVEGFYQTYLGRTPDAEGMKFWWGKINSGELKGTDQLKNAIISSPEAAPYRAISTAYKTYMGREPDAAGLSYWLGQVNSGKIDVAKISDVLKASDEAAPYRAIEEAYIKSTGHAPDAAGAQFWLGKLNSGTSLADIQSGITNSQEAKDYAYNATVKDNIPKFYTQQYEYNDYGSKPKTNPDGSPLLALDSHAIEQDFSGYVNDVYQRILGRPATQAELAAFEKDKAFYTQQDPYANVSNAVLIERAALNSPEFKNRTAKTAVWVTDASTGKPVLIPSSIASLPMVGDLISNGGAVSFTPQTAMFAKDIYPEAYVESRDSQGNLQKTLDPQKLLDAIAADPNRYVNSLFATVAGGIKREQMVAGAGFANNGVTKDTLQTLTNAAQEYSSYLIKNGFTTEQLQNTYNTAQANAEKVTAQSIKDQKDTGSGWIDEMGDFLEKYEVTIMMAIAAPVMGAGLAAVAAGGVAAAGATAAVGAVEAGGFAASSSTLLAQAITSSIMGVANTGMALSNGADWEQALKTGALSSAAAFAGSYLGSQVGELLVPTLTGAEFGLSKAAAEQIARVVTNSLGSSLSSGVAAAINGKDISEAMLISGVGSMIGSTLAQMSGSGAIGGVAGSTASGLIAGQDFGTALTNSAFRGVMTLVSGLISDGASGSINSIKNAIQQYMPGTGDEAATVLATGVDKYANDPKEGWSITDRIAQAENPNFNPDEYRRINGISASTEAGLDYLNRGAEAGLPVNAKEAQVFLDTEYSRLTREWAQKMGYNSLMEIPPLLVADLNDKLRGIYGDNLSALTGATPDSIVAENPGLKATDFLPSASPSVAEQALSKNLLDKALAPGWYKPSSSVFSMPAGAKFASQEDIANAMMGQGGGIFTAIDKAGKTVYLVKDQAYWDAKQSSSTPSITGSASAIPSTSALGGMINATSSVSSDTMYENALKMTSGEKLSYFANMNDETIAYLAKVGPVGDTGGSQNASWLAQQIKSGANIIRDAASQGDSPLIYKLVSGSLDYVASPTLGAVAGILDGASYISSLLNGASKYDLPSYEAYKAVKSIADAVTSSDMKSQIQSYSDIIKKSEGLSVIPALLGNVGDNPAGAWYYVATGIVSTLPGIGLGKAVGVAEGIETASTGIISKVFGSNSGMQAARLWELSQEISSAGSNAYDSFYAKLKAQNPTWTTDQIDTQAKLMAAPVMGASAIAVALGQGLNMDAITVNMFGQNNATSSAFASLFNKLVTSPALEGITEGPIQSGIPAAMQLIMEHEIDPSITLPKAIADIAGQSFLSGMAGLGSAGAFGILQSTQDIGAVAVAANTAFDNAIKSSNYTMGELGTIIRQWIPQSTAVSAITYESIKNNVVYQVLLENPEFVAPYQNVGQVIDAVKLSTGVYDATILANIGQNVDGGKWADQVITPQEAIKMLEDKGLSGVTYQDAVNSGIIGIVKPTTNTQLTNYVSQQTTVKEQQVDQAIKDEIYARMDTLMQQGQTADAAQDAAIKSVADTLRITKADLLTKLGTTETALKTDITNLSTKINTIQTSISDLVTQYKNQGQTADAALQNAINTVANNLGTTKTDLLASIGQSETSLNNKINTIQSQLTTKITDTEKSILDKITTYENAGMARDTAQDRAISDVATQLGLTKADLAAKIGTTETNLVTKLNASQAALNTKIDNVQSSVMAKMGEYQAQGMTADAALQKAIDAVAGNLGTTKADLLKEIGQTESDINAAVTAKINASQNAIMAKVDEYKAQGLSADAALQKAVDAVAGSLGTTRTDLLTKIGTTEANLTAKIGTLQTQITNVQNSVMAKMAEYEAAGQSRDTALSKAITDVATSLGTTKTALLDQLGTTQTALNDRITTVQQQLTTTINDSQKAVLAKVAEYQAQGLTRDDAIQKSVDTVAAQLGTTRSDLLTKLGATETNLNTKLTATQAALNTRIDAVQSSVMSKMAEYQGQGLAADAALQKAIDTVAGNLGTTKDTLLAQIGTTEANLTSQINSKLAASEKSILDKVAQYEAAGLTRDQAIQKAVDSVASQLGTTKTDLIARIGATEATLTTKINDALAASQKYTQQQISGLQSNIQQQMQANLNAGMQSDAALQKAINDVSANLGTTSDKLLAQMGTNTAALQQQITASQQASQAFTQSQISTLRGDIETQMQANLNAGMQSDAALQKAINDVSTKLGTTSTALLAQMGTNQTALQQQITATQTQISNTKTELLAKIKQYQDAGYSSDQALQAAIDTVAFNLGTTKSDLLSQLGTTETALRGEITSQIGATESRLADLIAKNETSGLARDQATQKAVDDLAAEMGTSRTDLLSKIDLTSQQFQNEITIAKTDLANQMTVYGQQTAQQIADAKTQIQNQMQAYEKAGIDRDTALSLAVSQVSQNLGTTKADLLTKLGTSETNLRNEFTQQTTQLSTQVQDVAQLLGKPASQVTANDITMVQNMIAQQTATDLAYDVNKDQKVDAKDLVLIQQQQQIQQNQNIKTVVDPNTGLTTYIDTTTNQPITGFDVAGTPWASTGIYNVLDQQQKQADETAKAQAQTAKTNQQKNNFNQMMNMVLGSSDVQGQTATVSAKEGKPLNYIYDFSSIFANPQQASLMPSPYGAVNTYGQSTQQPVGGTGGIAGLYGQAANQPMYKQASGFAEGGMINDNISVGDGGSVDDLLNILKGNSG